MARPHGRPAPRTIRNRPASILGLRTRPRRRKLPATPKTDTRQTRHRKPATKKGSKIRNRREPKAQERTYRLPTPRQGLPPEVTPPCPDPPCPIRVSGHQRANTAARPLTTTTAPCQHRQVNADGTRTRSHAT